MKLVFVGTSDTAGIPVHMCECLACKVYRRENRFNSPTCAYIKFDDGVIFIDAGSDEFLKIRENKKVFAHFLTHFHGDHAYGLIRLRHSMDFISCYHPRDEVGFADIYERPHGLRMIENEPFKSIHINGIEFIPIPLMHSRPTNGYLIKTKNKTVAYLTDCFGLEKQSLKFLQNKNIDAIFIDASYSADYDGGKHLSYILANKIIDEIGAKEGFLIHQSHYSLSSYMQEKVDLKYKYIHEGFEYIL